jgi:hypothetical protein
MCHLIFHGDQAKTVAIAQNHIRLEGKSWDGGPKNDLNQFCRGGFDWGSAETPHFHLTLKSIHCSARGYFCFVS